MFLSSLGSWVTPGTKAVDSTVNAGICSGVGMPEGRKTSCVWQAKISDGITPSSDGLSITLWLTPNSENSQNLPSSPVVYMGVTVVLADSGIDCTSETSAFNGSTETLVSVTGLTNLMVTPTTTSISSSALSGISASSTILVRVRRVGDDYHDTDPRRVILAGINLPQASAVNAVRYFANVVPNTTAGGFTIGSTGQFWTNVYSKAFSGQAGSSSPTHFFKVGGSIYDDFADGGNVTTGETDLHTHTTEASMMITNGQKLTWRSAGTTVAHATATRQIKLYFGGTAIFDSTALVTSAGSNWFLDAWIIRSGSATVRYAVKLTIDSLTVQTYMSTGSLGSLTFTNTNIIKTTGTAGAAGAATNDIIESMVNVQWHPAA